MNGRNLQKVEDVDQLKEILAELKDAPGMEEFEAAQKKAEEDKKKAEKPQEQNESTKEEA